MTAEVADPQTRRAALDAAWASVQSRTDATRAEFDALTDAAAVHPVVVAGQIHGALIVIGAEIHACVVPAAFGLWLHRPALRVLRDIVATYGRATTSVQTGCEAGARFVARLGFVPTSADGAAVRYEIAEVKYGH